MIQVLSLIVRRPDVSREEFREHYETIHAPLGIQFMTGLRYYARNHVEAPLDGREPEFDVLTEFGYADVSHITSAVARLASQEGETLRRDELTFMDKQRNVFCQLESLDSGRPAQAKPPPDAIKLAFLVKRPTGADRDAFLTAHAAEALPPLVRHAHAARHWSTHGPGGPGAEDEPAYDSVSFLWVAHDEFDPEAFAGWRPEAERVVRLRVSEHVSALPAA